MAMLSTSLLILTSSSSLSTSPPSSFTTTIGLCNNYPIHLSSLSSPNHPHLHQAHSFPKLKTASYRFSSDSTEDEVNCSFSEAVALFNCRDYYKCHDFLEAIWNNSPDPIRTLVHGILQCAVGFHHLFNQNHRGAMMELGEGLCKLRKMNLETGPFHQFEKEISAVLDFIYQTQLEQAACTDDFCLAMDQSERSYKLLGGYAAGQRLYCLETDSNEIVHIVFCPEGSYGARDQPRVKLPTLHASEEQLMDFEYT